MHRTHVDVFGKNRQSTTSWPVKRMAPTYRCHCFTPTGLLYCLVVLLLHRPSSSVANGKVTTPIVSFTFFSFKTVWSEFGQSLTLLQKQQQHQIKWPWIMRPQHRFDLPLYFFPSSSSSICPDMSEDTIEIRLLTPPFNR